MREDPPVRQPDPLRVLIVFIVWVLVAGWATATECAAYGVAGSLAIAGGASR
jgi:TRAP-type mannitol/chloroaromatic compound transport system permease large subunit